jgi:Squalene-hopene cyclase C-terminal domain
MKWITLFALAAVASAAELVVVTAKTGAVQSETVTLPNLGPQSQYSFLYSLSSLNELSPVEVEVRQGDAVLAHKTLHAGDPDYYTQFRVPHAGAATVVIRATHPSGNYSLQVNRWPLSPQVKSEPDHRWQDAQLIPLGKTVFASGDDEEYIPLPGTPRKSLPELLDWYKFDFSSDKPKLVFFQVDLMERDQIPVDVRVYRQLNGKMEEFYEGEDPVTLPHEVQALQGNKFTPRILTDKGIYYISVHAGHPEYKLRTRVYDAPPYSDPRVAVRTAVDYIMAAGDSWHANTPRRGGILDRVSSVHQETSLCVGCHVTHFPLRAQMYATRNGYPVVMRQQVQFLTERFYNNPRPFYGFEEQGAVWARMISAPANVLGRMSHLTGIFEDQITGEKRAGYHEGIAKYLDLYYAGRDKLPGDETNGNTPLVSAHEVAWYAWTETKDPRLGEWIAKGEVKNMIDLCYQTLALANIDREKYSGQIAKNAARILSLQRPSGQWSMKFEANQAEVEFQTGHALWALHDAGIPVTNPQVAKAIDYLMKRQQDFGGWMDPLQSFENFRTPFRETQMAVVALSSYFPIENRAKGWNSPKIERLSNDPVEMLEQLDNVWDAPSAEVKKQIASATKSNDALIRAAAVEALGRLGDVPGALSDPSKMVQRTSAWAVRQRWSRHADMPWPILDAELKAADDRVRWAATRVFAQHFSELAKQPEYAKALAKLVDDPVVTIRMNAIKGLWQFWFWTPDIATKNMIEDTLLAALGKPQHEWVQENLRHAIYNLADENIRYLYNNWVPLLGRAEDREKAIRGRLAVESRLATKFATVLEHGPDAQKKMLLTALTELPLRRGDIYDLEADLGKKSPPVYNRIGNDIEQIAFFGESADRLAKALLPLLDSKDPEMRSLAEEAAILVRDVKFPDVNRIAGPTGDPTHAFTAKVEAMPEAIEVAHVLKPPPPVARARVNGAPQARVRLDEAFFRGYVEPILMKRGKDGYACVHCHASHTLFNATYGTVMNVVDTADPENSLILRKPTSTAESEGVAGSTTLAHGGGVRFQKDSPEYVTILQWIKGAKE